MSKTVPTFVQTFPNLLGQEYCQLIIDRFEADDRKHPSTVGQVGNERVDPRRTGTILYLHDTMDDWKDVVVQTHAAVAKAVNAYAKDFMLLAKMLSSEYVGCRYPRIERVSPGQSFDWHADNASNVTSERILACLLYLSDVTEDGYTEFAHQGLKVRPEAGKVVVFPPYWTHLHRGVSPAKTTKYTMSFFWGYLDGEDLKPDKLTWRQRLTGRL